MLFLAEYATLILFRLLVSEKQQSFGGASISCKFRHLEKGVLA
jgi:hypothetical protein